MTPTARAVKASREIERLQARLQTLALERAVAVADMRRDGMSLGQVAAALGISRARAQQLAK